MSEQGEEIRFSIAIIVEPDGGEFHAYCPALKGLHTCGATEEEAFANAKDAAIAYLYSLIKHRDPIPLGVLKKEKLGVSRCLRFQSRAHERTEDLAVTTV